MILFLFTFFFLYGILHYYFFMWVKTAFSSNFNITFVLSLSFCMLFLMVTPMLVRIAETGGLSTVARILAYLGFTWMGMLFLFTCTFIIIDTYRLLLWICSFIFKSNFSFFTLSTKSWFMIAVTIVLATAIYGWFEAGAVRTEKIVIKTDKLPSEVSPLRIVQITDVHLGLIVRKERLERIINEVKKAAPHLLVSTGDLVDSDIITLDGVSTVMNEVKTEYGKFAVTGNHEFYAGLAQALAFTERSGFRVLRGESVDVGNFMTIVGMDDPAVHGFRNSERSEADISLPTSGNRFMLLLKHRPVVNHESLGRFDLQLSGHVHGGQIFPFTIFTRLAFPLSTGYHLLERGSSIYVSRGSGTWGPPIRFLSPPEVTLIELVHTPTPP